MPFNNIIRFQLRNKAIRLFGVLISFCKSLRSISREYASWPQYAWITRIRDSRRATSACQCSRVWLGLRNETVRLIRLILVIIKSTSVSLITRVGARNYAFVTYIRARLCKRVFSLLARSDKYFIVPLCGTPVFHVNYRNGIWNLNARKSDLIWSLRQVRSSTYHIPTSVIEALRLRIWRIIDSIKLASSTRIIWFGFDLIHSRYYGLLAARIKRYNWNRYTSHVSNLTY